MAKKIIDNTPLQSFEEDWGGTYQSGPDAGKEWGKTHSEVERVIKEKVAAIETEKVSGVIVNEQELPKGGNGKVSMTVPVVSDDLSDTNNTDAAQAGKVAEELNAIKSNIPYSAQLGDVSQDGSTVRVEYYNEQGDHLEHLDLDIPAAQDLGEVIMPKVTTELLTPALIKLGDTIRVRWTYDCIRKAEGSSESVNIPALNVVITVKIGQTTVHTVTKAQVPVQTTETLTLGPDVITSAGTVSVTVVATAEIDEETKTSRGSKSVTVITMDLATTFDPASQLALTNGYTDAAGQIAIPYSYTVPIGTTLRVWVDGVLDATSTISGTGRNYVRLTASDLSAGRHNIQMVAENGGLLSNVISVDLLKAGGSENYLGMRIVTDVEDLEDMPIAYAYGSTALPLTVAQFEELAFDVAAWSDGELTSSIVVSVDGDVTQTLTADRSLQQVTQRFDVSGSHTLTIQSGETALRTFAVEVSSAAGVTETETVGYRTKLTATGRSNTEANPADWGGITEFTGVDWRTNGWNRGSDGVDALLLTNGAKAEIDVKPFVQDESDGDYSIQNRGMTLEMEVMLSQVMERGATVVSSLCDNNNNGYPMGIKVTTEEAGLYFGGVEEITTAEDLKDAEGNYIDYEGNIVDEEHKVPLKITRPHGVARNIAIDRWIRLSFVVTPVVNGYGLAMLYINGKLSGANRYSGSLRQNTPAGLTFDSDKANIRIRNVRYYRIPLIADEVLANFIIDRPTGLLIQTEHNNNAVGDQNNTTDSDGNIAISHDALLSRGRGILTIIRSGDSGNGLDDLLACVDKKQDFLADYIRWEPPLDAQGNPIGEGFEAWNVVIRIQGTSSVKYPYKNIRIYLTKAYGTLSRTLHIGGVDVTDTADGYALRGSDKSIAQGVLCPKTDFVDSSLAGNTGGAHLFNDIMVSLGLTTPPQEYDSRVRQSIDGLPCDIFAGKSTNGTLTYYGQFVLNNEKSKSGKIFGMEGVKDAQGNAVTWDCPIALEALDNNSPMTLFHPAGSADSQALADQLASEFDKGFEFNFPEDAKWANIDEGQWDAGKNKWSVKPLPGARAAVKRWMGWIYDCVPSAMRSNPEYGTQQGWTDESKAKWVSNKFKTEVNDYFDLDHLLTYYIIIDYLAGKDQLAKNILWRTWDGLKWFPKYYDGDTWGAIRNDAFIVYLYNITRDSYDSERSKYAFEGHSSWLWCLVLANLEDELKQCAATLRTKLTNQAMFDEFLGNMIGNWSARQYNKSGKLKYIDTIDRMNYVYTLTGSREEHIRQFITDRARLLDARYGVGNYNGDVITFTVVRQSTDTPSSLMLKSGDLYYFGYKLNGLWLQGPSRAAAGESLTLNFTQTLATNDPLMLGGASCIKELDFTNMGSQLNGTVGLSLCAMLSKLVMPTTNGVANAPLTLGNISKLEYVDISGQTAVHTGTVGVFDLSKHTRLTTLLAGGTSLTRVILPEGAPLQTLTLPATLQILTLRYLPKLYHSGLTLQGTSNITALNFAECPNLSWQTLLTQCQNIDHVRIEGMSGRVRSAMLRPFMTGYRGLTADGQEQTYPALIGRVQLIDDVEDFDDMKTFFEKCGLTVIESQYTDYVFHDEETDPANISNENAQTGYGHQTAYAASGSVVKIHDASWPVTAYVNPTTHKMHVEPLSKSNLAKYIDNIHDQNITSDADITGSDNIVSRDVFLLLTRYYYKGVNDYMNAEKHFLLSHLHTEPDSTASRTRLLLLDELTKYDGSVPVSTNITVGNAMGSLSQVSGYDTYRVDVEGYRQVRFPGMNDNYTCIVFTDEDGTVVAKRQLWMATSISGNPMDFDNTIGDYVFMSVPDGAKYLYFCIPTAVSALYNAQGAEVPQGELGAVEANNVVTGYYAVLLTDSSEIEAIEPRWVEHKPELIGIYQGWANSNRGNMAVGNVSNTGKFTLSGPLRSISGKITLRGNGDGDNGVTGNWTYDTDGNPTAMPTGTCSGTAADFLNLASVRTAQSGVVNGEYSAVTYETSKDMANLLMAYFGTRDIENIVGMGGTPAYTTGTRNSVAYGNTVKSGTAGSNNTNQLNKMWGLEGWTGSMYEWMDGGCFNAPSYRQYLKDKRPKGTDTTPAAYVIDYRYNILQQDGKERRVKAATDNQRTNVARVRFGRYCDVVASSYAGDGVYATCYAAFQSSGSNGTTVRKGLVLGRSNNNANANAGVAYVHSHCVSADAGTGSGARLCFFGELENESDVI